MRINQNLSTSALYALTVLVSTTELGVLFRLLTVLAEKKMLFYFAPMYER